MSGCLCSVVEFLQGMIGQPPFGDWPEPLRSKVHAGVLPPDALQHVQAFSIVQVRSMPWIMCAGAEGQTTGGGAAGGLAAGR